MSINIDLIIKGSLLPEIKTKQFRYTNKYIPVQYAAETHMVPISYEGYSTQK